MDLYFRFFATTLFGLVGIGQVLTILMDGVFNEWDAFAEIRAIFREVFLGGDKKILLSERAEDVMLQYEKDRAMGSSTRLLQQRRDQLREIDEVEHQLSRPHPSTVTLAASSAAVS